MKNNKLLIDFKPIENKKIYMQLFLGMATAIILCLLMSYYTVPGYNNPIIITTGLVSVFVAIIPLTYFKILPNINYIYRLEIIENNLLINWKTTKTTTELIGPLEEVSINLSGKRLILKCNGTIIKQGILSEWNLKQMQMVENAIKEAQAAALNEVK